jgi:hypothetical protein
MMTDKSVSAINKKIDSIINLNLSTDGEYRKLDSTRNWKNAEFKSISQKSENLKRATQEKLKAADFPPALEPRVRELKSTIDELDIATSSSQLSPHDYSNGINITEPWKEDNPLTNGILDPLVTQTPTLIEPDGLPQLPLPSLPADLEAASNLVEQQVVSLEVLSDMQDEIGQAEGLSQMAGNLGDNDSAKKLLLQEVRKQAVNHFAGKEEHLQRAMETLTKFKKTYSSLQELSDASKKRKNEMNGKPFIERIVPGINFQVTKESDLVFVDFNPYVGYRITGRMTASVGWNQRVGYDMAGEMFTQDRRIVGPRTFGEFKLGKGFSPRAEIEIMNTIVTPLTQGPSLDPGTRDWVWGVLVGLKKEYIITKHLKGTATVMARLFDPHHKSPYADVVNVRFGFELMMKKKESKLVHGN